VRSWRIAARALVWVTKAKKQLAVLDLGSYSADNFSDDARVRSADDVFHLHRLDRKESLAGLDDITDCYPGRDNDTGHGSGQPSDCVLARSARESGPFDHLDVAERPPDMQPFTRVDQAQSNASADGAKHDLIARNLVNLDGCAVLEHYGAVAKMVVDDVEFLAIDEETRTLGR
jgi:hypothetical protein